jgi:FdhE protein
MSASDFYKTVFPGLEELRDTIPGVVDFYGDMLKAQQETGARFKPDMSSVDVETRRAGLSDGKPLLAPGDIRIDTGLYDALFDRIEELRIRAKGAGERVGAELTGLQKDGEWHASLVKALMSSPADAEELAGQAGVGMDVLMFVGTQALVPFVEAYAADLMSNTDTAAWWKGMCPVCAGEPLMARLADETGQRFLGCYLCRTEWPFKRLECPFCGCTEQAKLRYFYDDQDPCYRVEVCDQCKTYLKTVDARKANREICLFVENLASLHLDLVARKEGFCRDTNRLFGL